MQLIFKCLSTQHLALRGHRVHVPVPGCRQVHVPLPGPEKGGDEQQRGQERDLADGSAVCQPRTEAHKPASMRKQPLRMTTGPERMTLDWCTCIEQMQRFTILFLWNKESCVLHKGFIWLCFWLVSLSFCFVFKFFCVRNLHLYPVSLVLKSYRKGIQ